MGKGESYTHTHTDSHIHSIESRDQHTDLPSSAILPRSRGTPLPSGSGTQSYWREMPSSGAGSSRVGPTVSG